MHDLSREWHAGPYPPDRPRHDAAGPDSLSELSGSGRADQPEGSV